MNATPPDPNPQPLVFDADGAPPFGPSASGPVGGADPVAARPEVAMM